MLEKAQRKKYSTTVCEWRKLNVKRYFFFYKISVQCGKMFIALVWIDITAMSLYHLNVATPAALKC